MCGSSVAWPLLPARLDIVLSGGTDCRDVVVCGDLDLATVDQLRSALTECAALGTRLVVVDVSEVGFVSISGLNVLVDAHRALAASGARLMLARPNRAMERVLRLTGLHEVLRIHGDPPADAVHAPLDLAGDRGRRRP